MLPDEQPSPEQILALRALTGQKRLHLAESLYWSARKMKKAGVKMQHPEWSDEQVDTEVLRLFHHARS